LKHLDLPDQVSRDRICHEAQAVLGKCVPPSDANGNETGLIVGYVQSGKTMSFTTVAALARDNGYPLVIVIAGTSIPLFKQSEDRLKNDLRLRTRADRKWKPLSNPKVDKRQHVESALAEWRDKEVPEVGRQTVLITVMKNHTHLRNLNKLLAALDLKGVPVLIIDDEADQAGLNTAVNKGGQSTTYRHLVDLRHSVPHHTYLQYTATPQAPLLINIIDVLSPEFAEVLTPGGDYTGGKEFFGGNMWLARTIPAVDIPSQNNVLTYPPESLQFAMRLFYLGVAAAYVGGEPTGNRSMMVHPSQKTIPHSEYANWVRNIKKMWEQLLSLSPGSADRQDVVDEFYEAYKDLEKTVPNLPSFDAILDKLPRAIRKTMIEEINSKQRDGTPQIEWKNEYSWILVGGQAMDRGFTVEGLTVTYMPRGMGVGNADTIQQRARFFGYKKGYLGFCRVFVEDAVGEAFRAYVDHEEDIRNRLSEHSKTNKPLLEWKRAFFLDTGLKPTRRNVLNLAYIQDTFSDEWFIPTAPHDSLEAVEANRELVTELLGKLNLVDDEGHSDRTETQRHSVARNISLAEVYTNLLPLLRVPQPTDSQKFTGMLLQVERYLELYPHAVCTVFQMSGGKVRMRSADDQGKLLNLFQGAHPNSKGAIYRGDRYIREDAVLTIQIHNLTVRDADGQEHTDVPAVAVWVPKAMSKDWLSQLSGS
jgi:hypothetical protein